MATTFLILSDTHDDAFPDPSSLPKADVVLHCGDLTMIGGLSNYKKAIANINALDAELMLVIAGNHDVSLDPKWWQTNLDEDDDDPAEPSKALELFRAENTNGHLLEEGTRTFRLSGNRAFTIYASPYTPEFNGCPMLYAAVREAKPMVHCFGHLHEGYGVQDVSWSSGTDGEDGSGADEMAGAVRKNSEETMLAGAVGHTLLVNAAIMIHGEEENNRPWLVNLGLGGTE